MKRFSSMASHGTISSSDKAAEKVTSHCGFRRMSITPSSWQPVGWICSAWWSGMSSYHGKDGFAAPSPIKYCDKNMLFGSAVRCHPYRKIIGIIRRKFHKPRELSLGFIPLISSWPVDYNFCIQFNKLGLWVAHDSSAVHCVWSTGCLFA